MILTPHNIYKQESIFLTTVYMIWVFLPFLLVTSVDNLSEMSSKRISERRSPHTEIGKSFVNPQIFLQDSFRSSGLEKISSKKKSIIYVFCETNTFLFEPFNARER